MAAVISALCPQDLTMSQDININLD